MAFPEARRLAGHFHAGSEGAPDMFVFRLLVVTEAVGLVTAG